MYAGKWGAESPDQPAVLMAATGESLTHRQLEVLELLAKGLTNPEIAGLLGIGLGTVKTHVSAIIESLGVVHCLGMRAADTISASTHSKPSPLPTMVWGLKPCC